MIRTVVFDIGGVLVPEGNRMNDLQTFVGEVAGHFDSEKFQKAYWDYRNDYDLGCTDEEFWSRVFEASGINALEHVAAVAHKDAELNSTIAQAPLRLLEEIHQGGVHLAILSNAPRPMAKAVAESSWGSLFATKLFSSDLGIMKPSAAIYQEVDRQIELTSGHSDQTIFFDDRRINVDAANHHGWQAYLWETTDQAREDLINSGVLSRKLK